MPDIDLDFPRDVRERLIEAVIARYGAEHAALVAAFPTFRVRMAVRELGKALALPEADLERLARLADDWSSAPARWRRSSARLPDGEPKLRSPRWRALAFLAREAAGLPRHLSQHSGGMVVSARPLVELVPVVPGRLPRPPDLPVGQGLVRRRRLREDRPARAWGCSRPSRSAST